jgi:phytanoyl-CoA hydroxylase
VSLADSDRDLYWEQGYLILRGLFAPQDLRDFEERFLEFARGTAAPTRNMVLMQDVMVARGAVAAADPVERLNKLLSFEADERLFAYALFPALLEAVRSLLGPELQTLSSNVFNKPPGVDGRHPMHQDLRYFSLRPADGMLGTWTAMSRTHRANGCLAVIPRSHREGLLEHAAPDWEFVNRGFVGVMGADLDRRVHVELEPGDTLLFHPLLIHGSGRNRSPDFRRAISVHYASRACERPEGKRKRAPVIAAVPDERA